MFEIPSPYSRPSSTNGSGWKPGTCASHGSRPEYEVSMWPLSIRVGPPPVPSAVLDLLPLNREAYGLERVAHQLRHRLLGAGEAGRGDHPARELDEAVAVDLQERTSGSTRSANNRSCPSRSSPQSSSITCVQ